MRRADRTSAMIEVHRAAEAAHMAACSAYSRRQQALIDEGIGLRPFTMLVSQGQPIAVYTHAQIDACATPTSERKSSQMPISIWIAFCPGATRSWATARRRLAGLGMLPRTHSTT
jgi:hypothetical protein